MVIRSLFKLIFILLLFAFLFNSCTSLQVLSGDGGKVEFKQDIFQIDGSQQIVSIIEIPRKSKDFSLNIAFSENGLSKTSILASESKAVAAINGGFFNVKEGYSVTYLEKNDSIISPTRATVERQKEASYFLDGAVVFKKDNVAYIESFKGDEVYANSEKEEAVLVTGPILLSNGRKIEQKKIPFVENRHPRSCFCTSQSKYYLIAIDGRSDEASGMSLAEVQDYLLKMECEDAINLDGGGSTSLWHYEEGLINTPSDKKGERPVSNALIVTRKR